MKTLKDLNICEDDLIKLKNLAKEWKEKLDNYDYEEESTFTTHDEPEVIGFIEHFFNLEEDDE